MAGVFRVNGLRKGIKISGGAGPSKKPKTLASYSEFFFTLSFSKCVCLIYQSTIAISKKGNVEQHFWTVHKNYDTNFPPKSELRKRKVKELKCQLSGQQSLFSQHTSKAKAYTEASFRVSHLGRCLNPNLYPHSSCSLLPLTDPLPNGTTLPCDVIISPQCVP